MTYVKKMVVEIMEKVTLDYRNSETATKIVQQIIADTEEKCRNPIPIIELAGVKELVKEAYSQGVEDALEIPLDELNIHNITYKYMKALEAK